MTPQFDQEAVDAAAKRGVKIITLSKEELARFRQAVKPLWDEEAKKSPYSAKLVTILRENLASKGVQ